MDQGSWQHHLTTNILKLKFHRAYPPVARGSVQSCQEINHNTDMPHCGFRFNLLPGKGPVLPWY